MRTKQIWLGSEDLMQFYSRFLQIWFCRGTLRWRWRGWWRQQRQGGARMLCEETFLDWLEGSLEDRKQLGPGLMPPWFCQSWQVQILFGFDGKTLYKSPSDSFYSLGISYMIFLGWTGSEKGNKIGIYTAQDSKRRKRPLKCGAVFMLI